MSVYFDLLLMRVRRKLFMLAPNETRIRWLRAEGVRIGKDCVVHTPHFSTEPYLVEIGDHVAISSGTEFITHDGAGWMFQDPPNMALYGRIRVGSNTFIGLKVTILPDTTIGANCLIGSGSVVRGVIPDNSVVMGNPAKVIMQTQLMKKLMIHHRNRLDTYTMTPQQKREALCRHFGIS